MYIVTRYEYVHPLPPWYIYCPPPHPRCTPTPPILHTPAGPLRGKQPPSAPLYHSIVYHTLVCHLVRHVAMRLRMKTGFGQTYIVNCHSTPWKWAHFRSALVPYKLCKFRWKVDPRFYCGVITFFGKYIHPWKRGYQRWLCKMMKFWRQELHRLGKAPEKTGGVSGVGVGGRHQTNPLYPLANCITFDCVCLWQAIFPTTSSISCLCMVYSRVRRSISLSVTHHTTAVGHLSLED